MTSIIFWTNCINIIFTCLWDQKCGGTNAVLRVFGVKVSVFNNSEYLTATTIAAIRKLTYQFCSLLMYYFQPRLQLQSNRFSPITYRHFVCIYLKTEWTLLKGWIKGYFLLIYEKLLKQDRSLTYFQYFKLHF
jgi:hypothetical protein